MTKLRPGCSDSSRPALPDDTAYFLIRDAVARRRRLIYGRLDDGKGGHCAIGSFWEDNPGLALHAALVDEVAAVNDSIPESASPKERWKKVMSWLRWKIRVLSTEQKKKR